jgi:hypothetical protein
MVRDAWKKVLPETIANCWKHTGILPPQDPANIPAPPSESLRTRAAAWGIVRDFAKTNKYMLPAVEAKLQTMLGNLYVDSDWRPALSAIMNAEEDGVRALKEVERLAIASLAPPCSHGTTGSCRDHTRW